MKDNMRFWLCATLCITNIPISLGAMIIAVAAPDILWRVVAVFTIWFLGHSYRELVDRMGKLIDASKPQQVQR